LIASEIEQKITPAFFKLFWNVVPTLTLSNTASTATLRPSAGASSAPSTPARIICSLSGMPSFFIGFQQLGVDLVQRLRLFLHALGRA
jgi:hypothetical protein